LIPDKSSTICQITEDSEHYVNRISECTLLFYFFVCSFFPFDADFIKLLSIFTLAGCWIIRMVSERHLLIAKTSVNIPIASFLLCSLVTSLHSVHINYSLGTILHDYFAYFIIFFCTIDTIRSPVQIRRIVKCMLITCGLVCAYGMYGYYSGIAIRDGRFVATFEYHSRVAKYISLLLPIAVSLFFYYRDKANRIYLFVLIGMCGFSLILTMNRTSWVAILVSMLFISFAVKKRYLILLFASVCSLLIVVMPAKFLVHAKTITQIGDYFSSNKAMGERLLCWKASLAMFRDRPFWGIGPGKKNFREAYQQYSKKIEGTDNSQTSGISSEQPNEKKLKKKKKIKIPEKLSHAHNIILHILSENGIIGLLVFLWLFTAIFHTALKSWKSFNPGYEKILTMGIAASLISIFSHGLTDSFWKKPDALFLWYIIGILFSVIRRDTEQKCNLPAAKTE